MFPLTSCSRYTGHAWRTPPCKQPPCIMCCMVCACNLSITQASIVYARQHKQNSHTHVQVGCAPACSAPAPLCPPPQTQTPAHAPAAVRTPHSWTPPASETPPGRSELAAPPAQGPRLHHRPWLLRLRLCCRLLAAGRRLQGRQPPTRPSPATAVVEGGVRDTDGDACHSAANAQTLL